MAGKEASQIVTIHPACFTASGFLLYLDMGKRSFGRVFRYRAGRYRRSQVNCTRKTPVIRPG
jgi:hypothetical protein